MSKKAEDIKTILVIGNGRMGTDISCQCALYGKDVRVFIGVEDPPEKVEPVKKRQQDYLAMLIEKGMVSRRVADEASVRITFDDNIERICQGVDLVSESVLEAVPVKQATWKRFAPYLPKDAILTSNTSSLVTSLYADSSGAPERFLAWHFHTPVFIQNYVDIMPHLGTQEGIVPELVKFTKSLGLNCGVMNKEVYSYLANNMLIAVIDMAFHLWLDGSASFQDIDKAWMAVRVYPIGPFGICDKIGLPTVRHVYAARAEQTDETREIIARLDKMISEGRTGLEAKKGFYDYPNAEFLDEDFVKRAQPLL
jgi:3-hydroxybutyryl-CoA dehydrogenase